MMCWPALTEGFGAPGITTLATVIFPQDAAGMQQSKAGHLHRILIFGELVPFSILSTSFIGIWSRQT